MFTRGDIVSMDLQPAFSAKALSADWQILCAQIGERRAGTTEERRAAEFIAARFRAAGVPGVNIEPFPCASLRRATAVVHEQNGRTWRAVEARALVGAPGTPNGRAVTGRLAWLELPEQARHLRAGAFRDRIVAIFGPLPTSLEVHRRLV